MIRTALTAILLLAALAWASTMDYQDELAEERRYIEFVCDGTWPNYKNIKLEC